MTESPPFRFARSPRAAGQAVARPAPAVRSPARLWPGSGTSAHAGHAPPRPACAIRCSRQARARPITPADLVAASIIPAAPTAPCSTAASRAASRCRYRHQRHDPRLRRSAAADARRAAATAVWIPPHLGYSGQVPQGAPFGPNDTLDFDIHIARGRARHGRRAAAQQMQQMQQQQQQAAAWRHGAAPGGAWAAGAGAGGAPSGSGGWRAAAQRGRRAEPGGASGWQPG